MKKELGKDAVVVTSDARSLTDIGALAILAKAEFDTFDLLFVNAGFSIPTASRERDRGHLRRDVQPQRQGTVFAVLKLAPLINRAGSVVLTTSVANVKGMPGQSDIRSRQSCASILRSDAGR